MFKSNNAKENLYGIVINYFYETNDTSSIDLSNLQYKTITT